MENWNNENWEKVFLMTKAKKHIEAMKYIKEPLLEKSKQTWLQFAKGILDLCHEFAYCGFLVGYQEGINKK